MPIEQASRRRTLISLTPLIDVVFILLVFFMLAARLVGEGTISVHGTQASVGRSTWEQAVLLTLDADGQLDLNGDSLQRERLNQRLHEILIRRPQPQLLLRVSDGVVLQSLVDLLHQLESMGARNVTVLRGAGGSP